MWTNRNVWIILSGEMIAGLGLWTSIIANLEFMQQHVPSDFLKSLILFIGLLAGVIVGPYAGKIIDSNKKKAVLLYSGAGRLVSVCFMFLALHFESVWWMIMFAVTLQISAAFYFPALQSVIPMVVKEKYLLSMNGVHMNVGTVARIIGTALAGFMLGFMSLYALYVASFIAYVLLLASTWFLSITEENKQGTGITKTKTEGFKAIVPVLKKTPAVVNLLWLTIVPTMFIGGFNLMVINISELQGDSQIKSFLYAVEGICFILSGFIVKRLMAGRNPLNYIYVFALIIAMAHLALYFGDFKIISLIAFGLFGFGAGCFFPIVSTAFQTQVPKQYHGRFFSFRNMLDRVGFQVSLLGTGIFLDTIGFKNMVLLFGILSLSLTLALAVREKRVVRKRAVENMEA